ncbi:stage II sporulation protein E [Clostridium uliginosum]|uniref:Stage II sporulation protein E n=1 Tax=Clostridium uliginosum TaxID=119641 RepID=A0A1I1L0Y4_9CLOT|nr:stage II sporulation protein E [Clostridium uliginosum]SFC66747.1 stage II sporulation protein E [Clostridium uliginosum]
MQYELQVNSYKKTEESRKIKRSFFTKIISSKLVFILVGGILLGRVTLLLNQTGSTGIAPFGIAYLIAIVMKNDKLKTIMAALGVTLGYLTIIQTLTNGLVYVVAIGMLTIYYELFNTTTRKKRELVSFGIVLFSFITYGFLFNKYELGVNITISLIETLIIVPIYYIIKYSLTCLEEVNTNYFFTSEEVVSIAILFCLFVAGVGNITLMNYSVRDILALILVLVIAYIGGASYGATMGVTMGIILGCASNNMMSAVGFYGIGGLVVGIFKDTGKIFSTLAGIIIYFALGLYSENITLKLIVEVLTSSVIFLCLPRNLYQNVEVEINTEKKRDCINQLHLNGIKEEFTFKLKNLTEVLNEVSKTLENMDDNENLLIKNKSSALIESLADRVCTNCENKNSCWKRDFNTTYNSFQTLIKSCEEEKIVLPKYLEISCVKNFTLLKNAEDIVNNYALNSNIKERLGDGRQILSGHINKISSKLDDVLGEFKREVTICGDLERIIKRGLNKNSIEYNDIFCYTDKNGRIKVKLTMKHCEGANYCANKLVPIISNIMRIPVCVGGDGCNIDYETKTCTILIEETPRYNVVSYGAMASKDGESQTGDNYSFGKAIDGCYITILSDGMGSGPEAGKESKSTVDLVGKFMEAGFNEDTTINTVNSIMGMKFSENEKYATLDLSKIDLYNGDATFVKIGAVSSFIKRGDEVSIINSKNLPFGLVDEVELDIVKKELMPGDILVNVSDGILDINKLNTSNFIWLKEYLKDCCTDPRELSEKILQKARQLSEDILKDDMTVVVSKVYAV